MKTKFDSILKLKKQALDKSEVEIIKNNQMIVAKTTELDLAMFEFNKFDIPQNGTYLDFQRFTEIKKALMYEIDCIRGEISGLKNISKRLEEYRKIANIEFEKIKYLQQNEIKKKFDVLKKSEIKHIDEVALMLFASDKERV
ncbi:flagellar export protein FliJ [Helicobacter sp. 13S00477-4]|uniref:flagellar export protein FliJ n=1 Tax=Helicobacter sp. 13S00477-4 TaxID=1905759 RepID=UPI000BA5971F|nr:flagellar export protein FliJ [Helicobacter sp. 13S00477-4]PAF52699.1 hypothetical protein BKH44_00510 [Helicobacter sp. 13S00477-4]